MKDLSSAGWHMRTTVRWSFRIFYSSESEANTGCQPLSFGPPVLSKLGDEIRCQFSVDIAGGRRLRVDFSNSRHLHTFVDGSELYKCTVYGPSGLSPYYTGTSRLANGYAPSVTLYHHTSKPNKQSIRKSGEFWPSSWNIQGTEKKIANIGYVYFTPLPRSPTRTI